MDTSVGYHATTETSAAGTVISFSGFRPSHLRISLSHPLFRANRHDCVTRVPSGSPTKARGIDKLNDRRHGRREGDRDRQLLAVGSPWRVDSTSTAISAICLSLRLDRDAVVFFPSFSSRSLSISHQNVTPRANSARKKKYWVNDVDAADRTDRGGERGEEKGRSRLLGGSLACVAFDDALLLSAPTMKLM